MTTKRNGIVERCKSADGRVYYRGRVYLQDGSLSPRLEITPEAKRRSRTGARNFVDWAQEEEDKTHAIYNAKVAARETKEATILSVSRS